MNSERDKGQAPKAGVAPQQADGIDLSSIPKLAIISCSVLDTEVLHYAKALEHIVHIEMMPQGLHNDPPLLQRELQKMIDHIEAQTDAQAIALVYGLCSRGTEGVIAKRCKIVIARAHDCITHLLGSKERYGEYVKDHPGTYWYSPGWNKYHTPPGQARHELLHRQYVEKYGEDNAEFLMEHEQHWFSSYDRATYVDLTVGVTQEDVEYTQNCADWLKWKYDHQQGDPDLLISLLAGRWDNERFMVVEPGETFEYSGDKKILRKKKT